MNSCPTGFIEAIQAPVTWWCCGPAAWGRGLQSVCLLSDWPQYQRQGQWWVVLFKNMIILFHKGNWQVTGQGPVLLVAGEGPNGVLQAPGLPLCVWQLAPRRPSATAQCRLPLFFLSLAVWDMSFLWGTLFLWSLRGQCTFYWQVFRRQSAGDEWQSALGQPAPSVLLILQRLRPCVCMCVHPLWALVYTKTPASAQHENPVGRSGLWRTAKMFSVPSSQGTP